MPRDRSTLTVCVLAGLLVLVAVLMITLGLPEQTLLQHRLLQMYSVPLSGALGLGVAHLTTRLSPIDGATRIVLVVAVAATALGVGLMAAGVILDVDGLLPLGQALIWLALGFAVLWLVAKLPPRKGGRSFDLRPVDDE
ncbi:hypothetical protein [Micropruina sp.]|uniref:hypothetical protein n=1 Tax=Micropruina sp. TaxID=2737536 RepID=UPI0039E4B34C